MKIFLAGAVSSANKEQIEKYEIYKQCITKTFNELSLITPDDIWDYRSKCIKKNPKADKNEIDAIMVSYDLKQVEESDLIICDLSELSTGMGIELGVAYKKQKKVVFFYKKGSHISNMITGAFSGSIFFEYNNNAELEKKLDCELKNY